MPPETILILGGIREAAELAERLVAAKPNARIITSLAGRTRAPAPVAGEVRVGGFGGAEGLATWIRENSVSVLIDASHPFAERITVNAERAAAFAGIRHLRLGRPAWQEQPDDDWHEVTSLKEAAAAIPHAATAFLALGSQHLAPFATRDDCRLIVRMIDPPEVRLPHISELVLGRPSADPDEEAGLFERLGITCLVSRNSGGEGAYAKIVAARKLAMPVIMIVRPDNEGAFTTVDQVLSAMAI